MIRTVQPSIVIGSFIWDQDRVPRDEFDIRLGALNGVMDANGWKAILIYGDAAEHSALGYFSNFTTRLRWGMALLPRKGEPRLLVSMTPRDVPAMKLMTWIGDVHSGWTWPSVFDPWLAKLEGDAVDIGSVGFDMMRPPLFQSLHNSLGNRCHLHPADAAVAACRMSRPRELSLIREASRVTRLGADAFVKAWHDGKGAEAAALDAERTARMQAAQDVRTLVSFDGGQTLAPFRGTFDAQSGPLVGYIAVKHSGYWADMFVTASAGERAVDKQAQAALDAVLTLARPGISAGALHAAALAKLAPMELHPVLGGSVGSRIGLSPNEGDALTRDASHTLAPGDVYTLHTGARDASGGALASAMIAVSATEVKVLHRSPSTVRP